jgi:hypothetical protein
MEQTTRRRVALLVVAGTAAAVYFTLAPHWPKDNVVNVVRGNASAEVEELRVGYAPAAKHDGMAEDWTREAAFRFPDGSAPRVVTHEPRLADGEYVVEIEILTRSASVVADGGFEAPPGPVHSTLLRRRVTFQGNTTSLDISGSIDR